MRLPEIIGISPSNVETKISRIKEKLKLNFQTTIIMELDEFKNIVNDAGKGEQQLTPKIIDQMIERKYSAKIKKIVYPEYIGIVICLAAVIFIGLNFEKLDTGFLRGTGIVSIIILLALSLVSYVSLQSYNDIRGVNKAYVETLKAFASHKLRFYKLQKLNVLLRYLLMVTIIILISKMFNGKDFTENKYFWIFSFTFGYIFVLFYSNFVMKSYISALRQTEVI